MIKNKFFRYAVATVPLVIVNAICLAAGYFEKGNLKVNLTISLLFTVISGLILVTKLFFDFFVTLVALKSSGQTPDSGGILDCLLCNMGVQWLVTAAGLLLGHLVLPVFTVQVDMITFAIAHSVYYALIARAFGNATGRKVLYYVIYGCAAALCWGYVICNLLKLAV
jgi:hypothetical protein